MTDAAESTEVPSRYPACVYAKLPGESGSPWQRLLDYYYGGTDVERQVVDGDWSRADEFLSAAWIGDDIGDNLARAIIAGDIERSQFERALETGPQASQPKALRTFIKGATEFPERLDLESARRGAEVYRKLPPFLLIPHGIISGFVLAAITPNAAIPLSLNANIARATRRRYMRTARYVADLVEPGGLLPDGAGFQSACRIRLVHGFVRSEIKRHFDWKWDSYGAPISAFALLTAASVTGSWAMHYAETQGCIFTDQERADMAMFTAWQAFMNGVPEEYLMYTDKDWSEYIYWSVYHGGLPEPDDKWRAMSVLQPLLKNGYPLTDNKELDGAFNSFMLAVAREMLGSALCDEFDIGRSRIGQLLTKPVKVLNRAASSIHATRHRKSLYEQFCDVWWDRHVPYMVERITGQRTTNYESSARSSQS
jgi:hypothetical protein